MKLLRYALLSGVVIAGTAMGQWATPRQALIKLEPAAKSTLSQLPSVAPATDERAGGDVVWSEDFANGLAGNNGIGVWTTEGANGDIWKRKVTGPLGAYTPITERIQSTSVANGYMLFNADSANSTWVGNTPTALPSSSFTSWEGSLLTFMQTADPVLTQLHMTREQANELYGDVDERTIINGLEVDFFFGSQRWLVKHHAENGHPAWLYYFSRVLETQLGKITGAAHGAETPYVFQSLDAIASANDSSTGGGAISASDRTYAKQISAIWVNFARTGNPNGPNLPEWPAFEPDADVLLEFGQDKPVIRHDFEAKRMQFIEAVFDDGKL